MKSSLTLVVLFACACTCGAKEAFAQGKGGAGRGLGIAAGKAAAGAGAASAGAVGAAGSSTRAGATPKARIGSSSIDPGATAAIAGRVANSAGLQPHGTARDFSRLGGAEVDSRRGGEPWRAAAGATTDGSTPTVDLDRSLGPAENFERILQHRLEQAEHLRAVADRNGNPELRETADRMEASARRNFELQLATTNGPAAKSGKAEIAATDGRAANGVSTTARPARFLSRGFWFRSR